MEIRKVQGVTSALAVHVTGEHCPVGEAKGVVARAPEDVLNHIRQRRINRHHHVASARREIKCVVAFTHLLNHRIVARIFAEDIHIIARADDERIRARAAGECVVLRVADEHVVKRTADHVFDIAQRIVADGCAVSDAQGEIDEHRCAAATVIHRINARAAVHHIVAAQADQRIIPAHAAQRVVARAADDDVVIFVTSERETHRIRNHVLEILDGAADAARRLRREVHRHCARVVAVIQRVATRAAVNAAVHRSVAVEDKRIRATAAVEILKRQEGQGVRADIGVRRRGRVDVPRRARAETGDLVRRRAADDAVDIGEGGRRCAARAIEAVHVTQCG